MQKKSHLSNNINMSRYQYDSEDTILTEKKEKVKEPRLYKVLLLNDDYTTMDFVVDVLQRIFHKSQTEATHIMLNVHKKGVGVAGVYTYEIAETKLSQVHSFAESEQHPLKCSVEPE